MNLFGQPNISKMAAENDYEGLLRALEHRSPAVRLEAARALAEKNDGTGWRVLAEAVSATKNPEMQEIAADMLSELGSANEGFARRAAPLISEALKNTHGETAAALRDALEAIGGPHSEAALRQAGYEPAPTAEVDELSDYDVHFVRPVLPEMEHFQMLSAEQHLNNAVQLREAEMAERGLVENSLALWLKPDWGYAWYLRGVLFEDLERPFEALLAYERALLLDSALLDAREALDDLREEHTFLPLELDLLVPELTNRSWSARRDAAAALGEIAGDDPEALRLHLDLLLDLLEDGEREVRHAAIHTLGLVPSERVSIALVTHERESSWLLRFSIIEALADQGNIDGLVEVLRREMNRLQERNPVFSSQRDPLVEVEYGALMEIGVRALERAGDLEALLEIAEGNAWVETEDESEPVSENYYAELDEESEDPDYEEDDDLMSYVDEAAMMVTTALERLAITSLAPEAEKPLPRGLIERLARVPDLTLIDLSPDESEPETETSVVHDLSAVRAAAQAALERS